MQKPDNHFSKEKKQFDVLIVDDDALVRRGFKRLLGKGMGFSVETVNSADEALRSISAQTPDLILLDIDLGPGEMNGLECLQTMRSTGFGGTVCMFTADPSPQSLYDALIAGADDYLVKAKEMDLLGEIRNLLQQDAVIDHNSISACGYLRSLGMSNLRLSILREFVVHGFPSEKELSPLMGRSENAIWKHFAQIRDTLGLENNAQLVHVLTILSGYALRKQTEKNLVMTSRHVTCTAG